jgi:hypothetical protein
MKPRHWLLAGGLAASACLALFGNDAAQDGIAAPVARERPVAMPGAARSMAVSAAARPTRQTGGKHPAILTLLPREQLFGISGKNGGDTPFARRSWTPPPPPPPPPAPPPPPSAPPLPFTYLGKKLDDGQWEVFLARGEQTLIVHAQSTIDERYRVDAIRPPLLLLTYLPLNRQQTLTIGGFD